MLSVVISCREISQNQEIPTSPKDNNEPCKDELNFHKRTKLIAKEGKKINNIIFNLLLNNITNKSLITLKTTR